MTMTLSSIAVIGGGLAGCECALALAGAGVSVTLFEMKPKRFSPAHTNPLLAELVCSNSLRSDAPESAVGQLKREMRALGSAVTACADATRVPAGKALAVDRELFAKAITERVIAAPGLSLVRREITALTDENGAPAPDLADFDAVVLAAGPLASAPLTESLASLTGEDHLYFYDAIAPVVDAASVNMDIAFWGARYQPEDNDYLNCPMNREEYAAFHEALLQGRRAPVHRFEKEEHFEGCMPIEVLAERGFMTLAFGPMKPVGFIDPRTGLRPFALLQLRAENVNRSMFNLVGCQTKLAYGEQERIFRMVPGLEEVEFVRLGSMHRNTFVNAPRVLGPDLALKNQPRIFLAGQITGVEGYVESAACGLWLGHSLAAKANGRFLAPPPAESTLGGLLGHLGREVKKFQPSNIQFALLPELGLKAGKAKRKELYAARAGKAFLDWMNRVGLPLSDPGLFEKTE